jgi:hypothetical protein
MRLKLVRAAEWFIQYLMVEAPGVLAVSATVRHHVRIWSDADGATKWIAVVLLEAVGTLHWTRMQKPDWLLQVLLTRGVNYIGFRSVGFFFCHRHVARVSVPVLGVGVVAHLGVMYSLLRAVAEPRKCISGWAVFGCKPWPLTPAFTSLGWRRRRPSPMALRVNRFASWKSSRRCGVNLFYPLGHKSRGRFDLPVWSPAWAWPG